MTGVHLEEAPPIEAIVFRRIAVAIDLGPQSARTLEWAAWLSSAVGADLTLVHVTPCMESRAGEYFDQDWRSRLADAARLEISRLVEETGAQPEVMIENGDAPGIICSVARELPADLLVIGRGSTAGMFGRLRANAYAIVRQSPCPVVSV